MNISKRKINFYFFSFLKHDFRASITVFFVALPLCLGISLASGAPVYSGLIAGIIGGTVVSIISKSQLSVSGPAAGLTAIAAAAIVQLGSLELFFLAVSLAGLLQVLLGFLRLGGFTHFIPSSVIKGMLAAIGIILISKQVPLFFGYDQPDFWTKELFNVFTFSHAYSHIDNIYRHTSAGITLVSLISLAVLISWRKIFPQKLEFIPASFIAVMSGVLMIFLFQNALHIFEFKPTQFISLPENVFGGIKSPALNALSLNYDLLKTAFVIAMVASLETLLSVEAIDKLDPYNRSTPMNRELVAQGVGNIFSGMLSGLPITAVIVRSSANAEAGARTRTSSFAHGVWLVLALLLCIPAINMIPYCVLAVILIRTGYNLAKPKMILKIYRQGREQFLPFVVTVVAILLTDLLIGVLLGIVYSIYFMVKHTYRAGYTLLVSEEGHISHYNIQLALNVSFLNKKRIIEMLERIPPYSSVVIDGSKSVYIDHDILEIFQDYKSKARLRHIELIMKSVREVETIELHG